MKPNLARRFRQAIDSMPCFGLSRAFMEAAIDSFGAIFDDPDSDPTAFGKDDGLVKRFVSKVYERANGTLAGGFWIDRVVGDESTPGTFLYEMKDAKGKGIAVKDMLDAMKSATIKRLSTTRESHPHIRKLREIFGTVAGSMAIAEKARAKKDANTADAAKGRLSAAEELQARSAEDANFSISELRGMAAVPLKGGIHYGNPHASNRAVMAGIGNIQGNKSDTLNMVGNVGINVPLKPGGRMDSYIAGFDSADTEQGKAQAAFLAVRLLCKVIYNAWTLAVYGAQVGDKNMGVWASRSRKLKAAIDALDSRDMLGFAMKAGKLPMDAGKLAAIYAKAKSAADEACEMSGQAQVTADKAELVRIDNDIRKLWALGQGNSG